MDLFEILQTDDAKVNYLKGLVRLAKCDGIIDPKELEFFCQAASALGLGEDDVADIKDCWNGSDKIYFDFATNKEKLFFLIEAVQLCCIDDDYADIEKTEMKEICEELGISLESLSEIEKWVYEGMAWNKRGEELLKLE